MMSREDIQRSNNKPWNTYKNECSKLQLTII